MRTIFEDNSRRRFVIVSSAIGLIAGTIGTAALIGGGVTAGVMAGSAAKKAESKQKRQKEAELDAQQRATAAVLAAPDKAAAKAKEEALNKRRRRAKTLLTGPGGVLEEAAPAQKTLLGQ